MKKNSFLNDILQNTSCPQGFWGRMILRGMNCFHASLARRGMKQVDWRPEWNVLDIGCGGGANVKRLLKLCPQGKVYGMDLSEESVAFARRHNVGELDRRCFIRQGDVCSLPYGDGAFDAVTAFETVSRRQGAGRSLPRAPERGMLSHQSGSERPRTWKGVDGQDKGNDGVWSRRPETVAVQSRIFRHSDDSEKRRIAYHRT